MSPASGGGCPRPRRRAAPSRPACRRGRASARTGWRAGPLQGRRSGSGAGRGASGEAAGSVRAPRRGRRRGSRARPRPTATQRSGVPSRSPRPKAGRWRERRRRRRRARVGRRDARRSGASACRAASTPASPRSDRARPGGRRSSARTRPRGLPSPADAVTLTRFWLVPALPAVARDAAALPAVVVFGGVTDWLDGARGGTGVPGWGATWTPRRISPSSPRRDHCPPRRPALATRARGAARPSRDRARAVA